MKRPGGTPALVALQRAGVDHAVHDIPDATGDVGYRPRDLVQLTGAVVAPIRT
jgi:hypothetical protein